MANYNQNQRPLDNRIPSGRANNRGSAMPPNGRPGPQSPNTGSKPFAAHAQKPLASNILGNMGNLGNLMNAGLGGGGLGALGGLLGGGGGGLGALGSLLGGGAGAGGLGALGSLAGGAGGLGNLGAIASALGGLGNAAQAAGAGTGAGAAAAPVTATPDLSGLLSALGNINAAGGAAPAAATPDLSSILSALGNINATGGAAANNGINPLGNLNGQDLLSKLSDLLASINSAPTTPQATAQAEEAKPGPGAAPDKEIIVGPPPDGETGQANQADPEALASLLAAAIGKLGSFGNLGNIPKANQQQNNAHRSNFTEHTNNQQETQADHNSDPEPIIEANANVYMRPIYSDKLTDEPYDPCSNCPHPCWHSKQHLPSFNEVLEMTANWNRY